MAADVRFLCSWQIQNGSITVLMTVVAVFFALQSAVLSVLLPVLLALLAVEAVVFLLLDRKSVV